MIEDAMNLTLTKIGEGPPDGDVPELAVIVIASNEQVDVKVYAEMIDALRAAAHKEGVKIEFIVIDDGVGADFWRATQLLARDVPSFKAMRFRRVFGPSVALRLAMERTRAPYIITTTWYLQVGPEAMFEVLKQLRAGVDVVATRRTRRVDSWIARAQSAAFNAVTSRVTGVHLNDLNCSFRGFRRRVLDTLNFHGDLFRFVPILAVAQGFRVEELPVTHMAERGPSTFLNINLYMRRFLDIFGLFFLMKFTKKPLRFFGLLGLMLFLAGFVIGLYPIIDKYVNDHGVLDKPETVVAIFLMVLGPIFLSIGLIGEIIIFTQGGQPNEYCVDEVLEHPSIDAAKKGKVAAP